MSLAPRHIDALPASGERTRPVRILALGFSRTALKTALEKLGYKPYHMSEALRHCRDQHLEYWNEALQARFLGQGKRYGKEEFDKFLGEYDVLEDIPCILFVDELLTAYPDAKVIITNRDVNSWLASMEKTFYKVMGWKLLPFLASRDPILWGPYTSLLRTIMNHWTSGDPSNRDALRQAYQKHYAHIRSVVPKDRLLEFESSDNWRPLCSFLGKPVPLEPYPRTNDAVSTVHIHRFLFVLRAVKLGWMWVAAAMVPLIAIWLGNAR